MTKDYVVGVDIGGQSSKIGLVDRMGNIVAQEVMRYGADSPRQYKENDAELFIEDLCKYIGRVVERVGIDSVHEMPIIILVLLRMPPICFGQREELFISLKASQNISTTLRLQLQTMPMLRQLER